VTASIDGAADAVLAAAQDMHRRGLVEGTAGNISARQADGTVVATPSSVDYATMTLDDLVTVAPDGTVVHAAEGRSPTSEISLHLAVYRAYDDVASVIHSHPVWATMYAVAHRPVPACVDEFTTYIGGEVRCARYEASGSEALGDAAVEALEGRGAALLANHGVVAVGPSPAKVLHIVALVERTAQIAWGSTLLGGVVPIPEEVTANFAGVYSLMRMLP
jgi:L-fuculose-phosphate aldolase